MLKAVNGFGPPATPEGVINPAAGENVGFGAVGAVVFRPILLIPLKSGADFCVSYNDFPSRY
jgi:hypothetical protein